VHILAEIVAQKVKKISTKVKDIIASHVGTKELPKQAKIT